MNYPSIHIQGSIISGELIALIRADQLKYQTGKDFGYDTNQQLKDEIGLAWADCKNQYTIFKSKLSRLKDDEGATSITRTFWLDPFLANLGYTLDNKNTSEIHNGKSYAINRRDSERDGFPIYLGGWNDSLDRKPDNGMLRMSPHALVQEYLNVAEHLYAIISNGKLLRLLRDATRLTRTSCLEFNLEKIFEEDLFADFSVLYRLLHVSRVPKNKEAAPESIIEHYHIESLASGSRIREKLSQHVVDAIVLLGNGFITHPLNSNFREALRNNQINTKLYYQHQLRLIYRMLFLFVIEEKNLVFSENKTAETKKQSEIYRKYYSLDRLRKLAGRLHLPDMRHHYELWHSLLSTFTFYESTETGKKLGIMALNGELFGRDALSCPNYDLHNLFIDNATLLNVLKKLCYFETDNKVLAPVNYRDLDVEEFGSVYEGLLELEATFDTNVEIPRFYFAKSDERSKTGSHYTPEELVQPLIKHSLEYVIEEKLKEKDKQTALLSIKICDVACGSGHILLSAARRIALELAKERSGEDQPNLLDQRKAMRDVIRNCVYGVDKNPLAVELCKVALWLEAHNPGEPLNFLDHHIKCGDAIVGLAHREELEKGIPDEAFKALTEGEKKVGVAASLSRRNKLERKDREGNATQIKADYENTTIANVQEAMEEYKTFVKLSETTPEEITLKQKAYNKFLDGKGYTFLKTMADTMVAQFFIPKNTANKDKLMTDGDFRTIMKGYGGWQNPKTAMATAIAEERKFFHWFLEFPDVFQKDGFDCILGNPPFLGGQKLSGAYGNNYLEFIKYEFSPIGAVDLVTYFFRRIFSLIKSHGFQSLISTKSIAQGGSREGGLDVIINSGGFINHAIKSMKWPGLAAVDVSLITISKNLDQKIKILDNKIVDQISSYLDDSLILEDPFQLFNLKNKSFQGSIPLGKGFMVSNEKAAEILKISDVYKAVLCKYLNGDDLNNDPEQLPSRFVINFRDWDQKLCEEKYPILYEILERLVKPERAKDKREVRRKIWWQFAEKATKLYNTIHTRKQVLVQAQTSKYLSPVFKKPDLVFSMMCIVFDFDDYQNFAVLSSVFQNEWAWKYCSTNSISLRYTPSSAFETFPFPQNLTDQELNKLEELGKSYHEHRRQLMIKMNVGLTDLYNLFHIKDLTIANISKISKQGDLICKEYFEDILKLRNIQRQIDESVLDCYGWNKLELEYGFYELDYLPENDRMRYTIHPRARKEILQRLLELNHKIHTEEVAAGLWDKKKSNKETKKSKDLIEKELIYKQQGLFELPNLFNTENEMKEFSLHEGIYSIKDTAEITGLSKDKVKRWFSELFKENYEGLDGKQKTDIDTLRISFHGLIELVVIGTLRDNNFTLKKILKARADLSSKTSKIYPFATNDVNKLKVSGSDIVFEFPDGSLITLDGKGQINIEFITLFFRDIIFNVDGVAQRLMPTKGKGKIVVDPKEGGGKPSIVGKEVWVELINSIYDGEDSIATIQDQYNLDKDEILAALEYSKQ